MTLEPTGEAAKRREFMQKQVEAMSLIGTAREEWATKFKPMQAEYEKALKQMRENQTDAKVKEEVDVLERDLNILLKRQFEIRSRICVLGGGLPCADMIDRDLNCRSVPRWREAPDGWLINESYDVFTYKGQEISRQLFILHRRTHEFVWDVMRNDEPEPDVVIDEVYELLKPCMTHFQLNVRNALTGVRLQPTKLSSVASLPPPARSSAPASSKHSAISPLRCESPPPPPPYQPPPPPYQPPS